ncbi:MAG: hypothetical protein R6U46_07630 [Marinilabilia sp.]
MKVPKLLVGFSIFVKSPHTIHKQHINTPGQKLIRRKTGSSVKAQLSPKGYAIIYVSAT